MPSTLATDQIRGASTTPGPGGVPIAGVGGTIDPGWVQGTPNFPLNNYAGTTVPTVTDDETKGYAPGSTWLNTTSGVLYACVTAATGAAVWVSINSKFNRGFSLPNGEVAPYIRVKTPGTYVAVAQFTFQGYNTLGHSPDHAKVILSRQSTGITVNCRLYDLTHGTIIAEVAGATPSANPALPTIVDLGTVSNVPDHEAILEIQLASSTNAAYAHIHFFNFYKE